MSLLDADEVPDRPDPTDQHGPLRKKKKTLACKRCRQRKQKCTETRPCENCTQSGAECIASEAAAVARPLLEQDYVQRLEERVAELEALLPRESVDHIAGAQGHGPGPGHGHGHAHRGHPRQPLTYSDLRYPPVVDAFPGQMALPDRALPGQQQQHPVVAHTPLQRQPPTSPESPLELLNQVSHGLYGAEAAVSHAHGPQPDDPYAYSPPSVSELPSSVDAPPYVSPELERFLVQTYFDMAQSQYPILLRHEFLQWAESWSRGGDVLQAATRWKGFFVYMVYAIAFLMTKSRVNGPTRSRDFYILASSRYLPYVLDHPDTLLRAQALLILTVYALHIPSRDHIIPLSSRAIRFCVESQLHLADTEPAPTDNRALVHIQLRRRVFWCAYAVDRIVCGSHDLPMSISDHHITVPLFDNIDDDQLQRAAAWNDASGGDSPPLLELSTAPTSVSSSLHVIVGRQIESEIQDMMLHRGFVPESRAAFAWRARILGKLKAWNARSSAAAEPSHKGYASMRWHKMIYYYDIVALYLPTRAVMTAAVPNNNDNDDHMGRLSGSLVVQASCQALLLFRRFQMAREIAQPWLGLLSQFQIGVTLLYCFFATPPALWPAAYQSTDVPDAVRACSSTLAVLAERWVEAECVRDVFEVLAREVPFGASWDRPDRISESGRATIRACYPAMQKIVMDRPTLRMINEMMNDTFVGADEIGADETAPSSGPPVGNETIVVGGSGNDDDDTRRGAAAAAAATPASAISSHSMGHHAHTSHGGLYHNDGHHMALDSANPALMAGTSTSAAAIFEGMDLQWAHLTHASSLEMDAQFHLPTEMDTTADDAHMMQGWMSGISTLDLGRQPSRETEP